MKGALTARGVIWISVYLLVVLAPLFALLLGDHPPARPFWVEFSAAIGYAGLSIMGLQFGLTARFRFVTSPWGEDVIYHFHRQLSLVALLLVLAHPALLFMLRPERMAALNIFTASWRARWGNFSAYALLLLTATALWRVRFRLRYEAWHVSHIILAIIAIVAGLIHTVSFGFYLRAPVKAYLWVVLGVAWLSLFVYTRVVRPAFLLRRPYRIAAVRPERGDSVTLSLRADGHRGFRFSPGQFAWLSTRSPFQITGHPFSLASSAERRDGTVDLTIRNLGDFTATLATVPAGQRVWLDGPYGAFTPGDAADLHVLIAGGIGITPMMCMLRTLADRGDRRRLVLLYANGDWDGVTFREELDDMAGRVALTVVHILEDPPAGWTGETGRLSEDILRRHVPAPFAGHEYFICGPGPMMDAAERILAGLDVPVPKVHTERYAFA
jgi:predicted ferric reductase